MQELSAIVFGQKHRLAIMAAIAQSDGLVNPTDLAAELEFRAQSALQQPLQSLTNAGLLTRQDGMGRVYYRRNPHSLWEAALELLGQALAEDIPGYTDPGEAADLPGRTQRGG